MPLFLRHLKSHRPFSSIEVCSFIHDLYIYIDFCVSQDLYLTRKFPLIKGKVKVLSTSVILFDLNYWPRQRLLNYGFFLYSIAPINFYFQISPSVRSHEMSSLFFFNIKVNPIIKQKGESCGHIQNLSSIPSHRRRLPMCCTYMLIYRASLRLDHLPCLNFSFSNFFIFSKLFDPILTWNSQFVTSGKVGNLEVEFGKSKIFTLKTRKV